MVFAGGTVIIALVSLLRRGSRSSPRSGTRRRWSCWSPSRRRHAAAGDPGPGRAPHPPRARLDRHGGRGAREGAWHRWAELVSGRPWIAIASRSRSSLVLAIPVFSLELGQTDDGAAARAPRPGVVRRHHGRLRPGPQRPAADRRRLSKPAKNDQASLDDFKTSRSSNGSKRSPPARRPRRRSQAADAAAARRQFLTRRVRPAAAEAPRRHGEATTSSRSASRASTTPAAPRSTGSSRRARRPPTRP